MQTTVKERIIDIRNFIKLDQKDFAKEIKVSKQVLSNIENGRNKPSFIFLENICNRYEVNLNWLVCGKGGMLISSDKGQNEETQETKAMLLDKIKEKEKLISSLQDHIDTLKDRKQGSARP